MSDACYFMGAKQGTKKKDGSWFGNCNFLFRNQYGDFICGGRDATGWFTDKATYDSCIAGVPVGASVTVMRDMAGHVINMALNPEFPDLLLE